MIRDPVVRLDSIGAEVRIDVHLDVGEPRAAPAASTTSSASSPPPPAPSSVPMALPLHAGRIVGGRYELVRLLGQGSMGAVWLANHMTLDEYVALKLMAPMAESSGVEDVSTCAARFRLEAQIAARLSRKTRHVVRVTDHGQDGALPYLVMELLEGQTLEKALLCRGALGLAEVTDLVKQVARGLEAAHCEGVLHRDLKPANVFLAANGEGKPVVKLLDFGVAWGHGSQRFAAPFATAKGLIVGTPGYMSPEQAAAAEIDVRADLWSLAAIAYEALTCELPVAGSDAERILSNLRARRTVPLRQRRPDLPEAVDRFFQRAFAPRIEDRHSTCAELAHAFEEAVHLGSSPAVTRRLTARPAPDQVRGRASTCARPAAVAFLAGVGLLGTWYAASGSWRNKAASRDASALVTQPGGGHGAATEPTHEEPAAQPTIKDAPSAPWTEAVVPSPTTTTSKEGVRRPSGDLGEFKAYY